MARKEPSSIDAEINALGCAFLSKTALDKICEELSSEMFYLESHRNIYEALYTLRNKSIAIDITTVSNELEKEKAETGRWMNLFEETYVVELETTLEERLRRNKTENCLQHKPSKRDLEWSENELLKSLEKHKLNSEAGEGEKIFKNYLKINNTNFSPEEVAKMIQEKFDL